MPSISNLIHTLFSRRSHKSELPEESDTIKELKCRIDHLQNKIDSDSNGVITHSEMESYFKSMIGNIDSNSDGIVTKSELEAHIQKQLKPSTNKIEHLTSECQRLQSELNTAKKESEHWHNAYVKLKSDFDEYNDFSPPPTSHVSEDSIRKYVDTHIINNPETNINWIPDGPEARIWTFMLYRSLRSVDLCLSKFGIDLPGHKLTLSIRPDQQ